jgi:hypothetical protein
MHPATTHAELERVLSQASGVDVDSIRKVRSVLSGLPSVTLASLWFGRRASMGPVNPQVASLRRHVRTRKALFAWVYGQNAAIASDLLYVRLPSSEKRRLVGHLRKLLRSDMPWLSSKIVHAMAFRPTAFGRSKPGRLGSASPAKSWGPLYARVGISKGTRRRVLFIPNPALMRVHRALLALLAPSLERSLRPCVFGVSKGAAGPTFLNASQHLGREYVASYDIENFFPSVSVADILRGLKAARDGSCPMFDQRYAPAPLRVTADANPEILNWTDDAMLLVARIATRRGRLPQGAPLSPLLASVAFGVYDDAIVHRLGAEFGTGCFAYSRYFDDLTVSISAEGARKRGLGSSSEVQEAIGKCISDCLRNTSFRLNQRKSRCSRVAEGRSSRGHGHAVQDCHEVTGLLVRSRTISLPRSTQRELRLTIHRLDQRDFVEVARRWCGAQNRTIPVFEGVSRGHRWPPTATFRRWCSAERLAARMLLKLHPDIRIRAILADWFAWQATVESGEDVRKGSAARPMLEWVLAMLWTGHLGVRRADGDSLIFSHQGSDVCEISAESPLVYFGLGRGDAIAVADYWHHLNGFAAYLGACPDAPEFSPVHRWRDDLVSRLRALSLPGAGPDAIREVVHEAESGIPITVSESLAELVDTVTDQYRDFLRRVSPGNVPAAAEVNRLLSVPAHAERDFVDWIRNLAYLFVRSLPVLPPDAGDDPLLPHGDLFQFIRIHDERALGLVREDYPVLRKVDQELRRRTGSGSKALPNYRLWQVSILRALEGHLRARDDLQHDWIRAGRQGDWAASLPANPYRRTPEERLSAPLEKLCELRSSLTGSDGRTRLFCAGTEGLRSKDLNLIRMDATRFDNMKSWRHVGEVAEALWRAIGETLDPAALAGEPAEDAPGSNGDQKRRNALWSRLVKSQRGWSHGWLSVLKPLRNACAHEMQRREEVARLQKRVASLLGKDWYPPLTEKEELSAAEAAESMILTGYEAMLIKAALVDSLGHALQDALNALDQPSDV